MINLSPFNPIIFASVFLSLLLFYVLGSFFTPRLSTPWRNISSRMAMGMFVFVTIMAVIHAGIHTLLFPFLLFLPFVFVSKPLGMWGDIKLCRLSELGFFVFGISTIVLLEMVGADIQDGDYTFIGNWDVAHTSGLGYDFYLTGSETTRFLWDFKNNRVYYHFGDLWLSGFYSRYLGVLPYYSSMVIYRSICIILLFILTLSWISPLLKNKSKWFVLGIPIFILFSHGIKWGVGSVGSEEVLWSYNPYLIISVGYILFSLFWIEDHVKLSLISLSLLGLFHPMISFSVLFGIGTMFCIKFLRPNIAYIPFTLAELFTSFLVAIVCIIYAVIDGRMYSVSSFSLTTDYILKLLVVIGLLIVSLIGLFPFIYGLSYFKKQFWFWQINLLIGVSIGFIVICPYMLSESPQILSIYFATSLIPLGSIGLFMLVANGSKTQKIVATLFLLGVSVSTLIDWQQTVSNITPKAIHHYLKGFDDEWISRSKISKEEVQQLQNVLATNQLTDIAFCICQDSTDIFEETILMSRLPFLRALFPGVDYHRLSVQHADTNVTAHTDMHKHQLFKRSTLYHFSQQQSSANESTIAMVDYLNPTYFLLDTMDEHICLPPYQLSQYSQVDTFGRFILFKNMKQ
jgi:hypothetical protein